MDKVLAMQFHRAVVHKENPAHNIIKGDNLVAFQGISSQAIDPQQLLLVQCRQVPHAL